MFISNDAHFNFSGRLVTVSDSDWQSPYLRYHSSSIQPLITTNKHSVQRITINELNCIICLSLLLNSISQHPHYASEIWIIFKWMDKTILWIKQWWELKSQKSMSWKDKCKICINHNYSVTYHSLKEKKRILSKWKRNLHCGPHVRCILSGKLFVSWMPS